MRQTPVVLGPVAKALALVAIALGVLLQSACGADRVVSEVHVASVVLSTHAATVERYSTLQLSVDVRTVDGSPFPDKNVTWSSRNSSVAVVSYTGYVRGLKGGVTTIVATAGSVADSMIVMVDDSLSARAASIWLTLPRTQLPIGDTLRVHLDVLNVYR